MQTASSLHRKLIDIPSETFTALSVKAATMGVSLKRLIETILEKEASHMDEAELYRYLVATRPEGKQMVSENEKRDFEKRLGINSGQ